MGAGISSDALKGKTREEVLKMCFQHLAKPNVDEDQVTLSNLMCMADDLSPAEIEATRSDFVKIDRKEKGYFELDEYLDYYMKQAATVTEDEFRIFCSGILR
jgi:hypothetical protein